MRDKGCYSSTAPRCSSDSSQSFWMGKGESVEMEHYSAFFSGSAGASAAGAAGAAGASAAGAAGASAAGASAAGAAGASAAGAAWGSAGTAECIAPGGVGGGGAGAGAGASPQPTNVPANAADTINDQIFFIRGLLKEPVPGGRTERPVPYSASAMHLRTVSRPDPASQPSFSMRGRNAIFPAPRLFSIQGWSTSRAATAWIARATLTTGSPPGIRSGIQQIAVKGVAKSELVLSNKQASARGRTKPDPRLSDSADYREPDARRRIPDRYSDGRGATIFPVIAARSY